MMELGALGTLVQGRYELASKALRQILEQEDLSPSVKSALNRVLARVNGAAIVFDELPGALGSLLERPFENPELQHEAWNEVFWKHEKKSAQMLDKAHAELRELIQASENAGRLPRPKDPEVSDAREELKLLLQSVPKDALPAKAKELAERAAREGNLSRLWLLTESGFAEAIYEAQGIRPDMARHYRETLRQAVTPSLPAEIRQARRDAEHLAKAAKALETAVLAHTTAYQSEQAQAARNRYAPAADEAREARKKEAAKPIYQ